MVESALPTAPVPRPPQPTTASLIADSPAAWHRGTATPANAEVAATWPETPNNRDLATFHTYLAVAERLAPLLDGIPVTVAESGVSSPEGASRMAAAGYDAILVGEAAARSADPSAFINHRLLWLFRSEINAM